MGGAKANVADFVPVVLKRAEYAVEEAIIPPAEFKCCSLNLASELPLETLLTFIETGKLFPEIALAK